MHFLVMAYRYGTNDYHFPVGVFVSEAAAIKAAKSHREFRGGKYDHKLFYLYSGQEYDAQECDWKWITGELVGK